MTKRTVGQTVTLAGYFANMALLLAWYSWIAPPSLLPRSVVLLLLLAPMLAPLRGLLHGRPYTYAWSGFIALFYFAHGVVEAYGNADIRTIASLEILFSTMWFCGSIYFVRQSRGSTAN